MSFAICRSKKGEMSPSGMKWNGCAPTVGVAILPMRTALSDFNEPQIFQNADNLAGLENGDVAHDQAI